MSCAKQPNNVIYGRNLSHTVSAPSEEGLETEAVYPSNQPYPGDGGPHKNSGHQGLGELLRLAAALVYCRTPRWWKS